MSTKSPGFNNPAIRVTHAVFEPDMDEDGTAQETGVWIVSSVIEAADGTRMSTDRLHGLSAKASELDMEAAIAALWGL